MYKNNHLLSTPLWSTEKVVVFVHETAVSTIVLSVNVGHTLLLQETPLFIIGESYNLWNSLNAYIVHILFNSLAVKWNT